MRLRLSPRASQPDAAGRAAVGYVSGTARQHPSAADPPSLRSAAGDRRGYRVGELQEIPLANHWTGATHYELHRPPGHGDVEVLCAHALDIQQHRDFGFQP